MSSTSDLIMTSRHFVILLLLVCSLLHVSFALDAKFTPTEGSEQLPLSAAYRESLRKLCNVLKTGGKLPADYVNRKEILQRMCLKLDADDRNIELGSSFSISKYFSDSQPMMLTTVLSLGGAYIAWTQRHVISSYMKKLIPKRGRTTGHHIDGSDGVTSFGNEDINQMIREARLKRLAANDS